jgi:membrane-associated protease RseP (regulator of RpoE activity)
MTRLTLVALIGTAGSSCSSAQEDTQIRVRKPVVAIATQEQPRELRVRLPRLREGQLHEVLNSRLFTSFGGGPRLGVTIETGKDGLSVSEVSEDSLAESAGVMPGDIIYRLGEQSVESADDVARALRHFGPGDRVPLTVIRAGEGLVELSGAMPEPHEQHGDMMFGEVHGRGFLGVEIRESEDDDGAGVEVAGALPNTAAWFAGLEEGDRLLSVDGNAVNRFDELSEAVSESSAGTMVELVYERDGTTHTTSVRLGHRAPQNPMSMPFPQGRNMSLDFEFPGAQLHGGDGMRLFFGGGDNGSLHFSHDQDELHEGPHDGPHKMMFDGHGSMGQLHELHAPLHEGARRIEVNINNGEGTVTIETEDGTQTYELKDGTWIED